MDIFGEVTPISIENSPRRWFDTSAKPTANKRPWKVRPIFCPFFRKLPSSYSNLPSGFFRCEFQPFTIHLRLQLSTCGTQKSRPPTWWRWSISRRLVTLLLAKASHFFGQLDTLLFAQVAKGEMTQSFIPETSNNTPNLMLEKKTSLLLRMSPTWWWSFFVSLFRIGRCGSRNHSWPICYGLWTHLPTLMFDS